MEKFFTDFGVQPVLMAAQIVNFLILLLILKKFLYRPIFKILEKRRQIATTTLENAETIEQRLHALETESAQKLEQVSAQAQQILNTATTTADDIIAQAHQKAQADIDQMLKQSQLSLKQEKEKMQQEISKELLQLVILGIEKTSGKILENNDQRKIIQQQLDNLKT